MTKHIDRVHRKFSPKTINLKTTVRILVIGRQCNLMCQFLSLPFGKTHKFCFCHLFDKCLKYSKRIIRLSYGGVSGWRILRCKNCLEVEK